MESYLVVLVNTVVQLITLLLIAHALLSFVLPDPWHPVRRFVAQIAEPIVRPFRNLIPPVGMFDFSIMIALFAIQVLGQFVVLLIRAAF